MRDGGEVAWAYGGVGGVGGGGGGVGFDTIILLLRHVLAVGV